MRKFKSSCVLAGAAVAMFSAANAAKASVLLYGFETGDSPNSVDGFAKNGAGSTVTQTNMGVTQGSNALLLTVTGAGFVSDLTSSIPAILDNPAVTGISADISVPTGTAAFTGTYALLGVTIFVYNSAEAEAGQFQVDPKDEQAIPVLTPGVVTTVDIPLTGADPDSGTDETYGTLLGNGWVPTGFEFFFDKNGPTTITVDNVQATGVSVPEPASISGLALGGLLLARRRRAAVKA